jgi:putative ABC transport system permease protein
VSWIALKMLMGDRAKYLGLIFGVTFATLLMTQQISIFMGIIRRTASQVLDVREIDIWVMDDQTRYIDEVASLPDTDLHRVRGVSGVEWAVPMYKGQVRSRLENGGFRNVILFGLDDSSMVGAPHEMIVGSLADLRQPDAVIIDKAGYEYMWPGEPYRLGRVFHLNDHRAVVVGVCKASAPFMTLPIIYTRYSQAVHFVPRERNLMNFVLVKASPDTNPEVLCDRIKSQTGLMAATHDRFFWMTVEYFLKTTGIPVNFGITIALGFVVGAAITGQTFYLFTIENLKQFGALKAMGVTNLRLIGMILLQALVVGLMGYSLGIGLTALFFASTAHITHLAGLHMTGPAAGGVGIAVLIIITITSLASIWKVLVLEPAVVFK